MNNQRSISDDTSQTGDEPKLTDALIDGQLPSRKLKERPKLAIFGRLASDEIVFAAYWAQYSRCSELHLSIIKDVLKSISSDNRKSISFTHSFDRYIGFDNVLQRGSGDEIIYAQLVGSKNWVPLITNRDSERTREYTIKLEKDGDKYKLIDSYYGPKTLMSPSDKKLKNNPEELQKSIEFWNEFAIVGKWMYQANRVIPGSEQKECPW